MTDMKSAALSALEAGLSVFPADADSKRPLVGTWKVYQEHKPSPHQVETWWTRWPEAALALVTGPISGLIVADVDSNRPEALAAVLQKVGDTQRIARTPSGGCHCYYAHPLKGEIHNAVRLPGFDHPTDLRADGGYVLAPPSKGYEWIRQGAFDDLPVFRPETIADHSGRGAPKLGSAEWDELAEGAAQGARNDSLARIIGKAISDKTRERWLLLIAEGFAARCHPPMDLFEVRKTVESIVAAEREKREREKAERERRLNTSPRVLAERIRRQQGGAP